MTAYSSSLNKNWSEVGLFSRNTLVRIPQDGRLINVICAWQKYKLKCIWKCGPLWSTRLCVLCVNNKCGLVSFSLTASLLPVLLWKTSLLTFLPFCSLFLSLPLKIPPSAPHPRLSSHFCPQSSFYTIVPLLKSLNRHPLPPIRLLTCLSLSLNLSCPGYLSSF